MSVRGVRGACGEPGVDQGRKLLTMHLRPRLLSQQTLLEVRVRFVPIN